MKNHLRNSLGGLAFASALIFNLSPCGVRAQGSLTPPGPPGPTMRTLQQVEPRTPIDSAPFTITQPGSYYLTTNLTVSSGNAIVIATNGVTLDLSGFTISSTASPATGAGILINSGRSDIAIVNGHIRGGVSNNGGVYNGPGFAYGISYSGTAPRNVRVSGINVSGGLYAGIYVGDSDSTAVEGCTARTVGGYGIVGGAVKSSVAVDCGGTAIFGTTVFNCLGWSAGSGEGVYALTAQNCDGRSDSGYGVFVSSAAQNCYGYSSTGIGVFAGNALNCEGGSGGSYGVYASRTAQNCYGSGGSYGVYALAAQNCYGYSDTGVAGLYSETAAFCVGYRSGGRAIQATIANGCWAAAGTNLITYKYNMP